MPTCRRAAGSARVAGGAGAQGVTRGIRMEGLPGMLREVQVEATFPDAPELATLHQPIRSRAGAEGRDVTAMIPGELRSAAGEIEINAGAEAVALDVARTGDRPVQVGSHFHLAEADAAPALDRTAAHGRRRRAARRPVRARARRAGRGPVGRRRPGRALREAGCAAARLA